MVFVSVVVTMLLSVVSSAVGGSRRQTRGARRASPVARPDLAPTPVMSGDDNESVRLAIVGRDRPLAVLADAVERAREGRGGLVAVSGEAGIGKTALVTEAAARAAASGWQVVHGNGWDGAGTPGLWPWIQILRSLERAVGPEDWIACRAAAGDGVGYVLGERTDLPIAADATFQLFDSVTTLLVAASRLAPLMVVLDDLHWGDPSSVRLVDFVVRHVAFEAVLVVVTYRDDEAGATDHPLRGLLLPVVSTGLSLPLAGIDEAGVAALLDGLTDLEPTPDVVADVHLRTGGNPFFVEQAARLWSAGGTGTGVPPGVRDAVERRLARLPSPCVDVLATASLLGSAFDLGLLAGASSTDAAELDRRLSDAVRVGLVTRAGPRAMFVHDLVRETLASSLPPADARRRHASIVRTTESSPSRLGRVLPAAGLAHHARLAVPEVSAAEAIAYLVAAGEDASARLAADEAARLFADAIALEEEPGARTEIALRLAAQQHRSGDLDAARATYDEILVESRRAVAAESFARAVLGVHALGHALDDPSGASTALIDEARVALERSIDSGDLDRRATLPLLARVLAAASRARTHLVGADREVAEALSLTAVDLARGAGDPGALGFCLLAHHDAIWKPGTAAERLGLSDEMTAVALQTGDRELQLQASLLRIVAWLELGDPRALTEHESFVALADRSRLPRFRYLALSRQGTVATLQGRFEEAGAFLAAARELGRQIGEIDTESVWFDQAWELARLRGRFEEIDRMLAERAGSGDRHLVVIAAASRVDRSDPAAALGMLAELEAVASVWPRWASLAWLTFRAELAAALADVDAASALAAGPRTEGIDAETVRSDIAASGSAWAVLAGAVTVHGPMAHWRAVLDLAERRWDDALSGFGEAAELSDGFSARPWSMLARIGMAESRLGRGASDDLDEGIRLLDTVAEEAAELGMPVPAGKIAVLRAKAGAEVLSRSSAAAASGPPAAFHLEGEVWTLEFAGRRVRVPDAKGLRDLHTLLAGPGRDIPAVVLLDPGGGPELLASRRVGTDPVLDQRAKAEYRARLSQLDERIETALDRGDDRSAAGLDRERAALVDELRRATGLGGRSRRLGDEAERARKTVTARIRDTLRRLDGAHPELAAHLRARVTTGSSCRYEPVDEVTWRL
jgi:tetratricopeptide (TPR) repeat protein